MRKTGDITQVNTAFPMKEARIAFKGTWMEFAYMFFMRAASELNVSLLDSDPEEIKRGIIQITIKFLPYSPKIAGEDKWQA